MTFENDVAGFVTVTVFYLFYLSTMLLLVITLRLSRLLDRYRLKYGFDRDIESKEMKNPNSEKLDKREKMFKRRVFKD